MDTAQRSEKQRELAELRARVARLEEQLGSGDSRGGWQRSGYLSYYATTGFFLGMFAALASLLLNVVGALFVGKHPLELIRVYLTFPLGERALEMESGLALAIGCCLYIGTGMLYGIIFQVVFAYTADAPSALVRRLAIGSVLGVAIWLVNFYGILSWLQPLAFGGDWIVNEIPIWVAALTHLVFGWTMAILYPWGRFYVGGRRTEPQQTRSEPA